MSLNPEYRYEGGKWGKVAIHVLYQPGDEASWGTGIAVSRTATALEWLDGFFGPFAWPQITNVHRIEGGGTEFPMMIHDGSPSQGLIVHELGHNYMMGHPGQQRVARGLARRGIHQLPDLALLRDSASRAVTLQPVGAVPHRARPRRPVRTGQPGFSRTIATSTPTTSASTTGASSSSTSSATSWATRRCVGSCGPTTTGGSSSMWTRRPSARWRRRCRGWISRPSSRRGCTATVLVDYAVGRVKSGRTGAVGRSADGQGGRGGQDGQTVKTVKSVVRRGGRPELRCCARLRAGSRSRCG